jgi:alpha-1,3-rhamnosyl/mannosyltransferase
LRVGFDGRCLTSPAGGVRRYTQELFNAIATLDAGVDLVALDAPLAVTLPPRASSVRASKIAPTNLGRALVDLPLAARRASLDVFHAPAYTAPLWGVHPLVLTIHDVSYIRHPEWYPYRRDRLRRAFYRRSARTADTVITDSEFSRREIVDTFVIDPEQVVAIPLGVGAPFAPAPSTASRPLPPNVHPPYVLHVGDLHARRNLSTALSAVLTVRSRHPDLASLRLTLAGTDRGERHRLERQAAAAGQAEALVFVEAADDATLVALYQHAAALVYPSRYEGFGLPLVEAMACGAPVVAANASAIPELVGSAGLLVSPDDTSGFADAIEGLLLNAERRHALRERSIRRAAEFSWDRTAKATIDVYRSCTVRSRPTHRRGRASAVSSR